MGQRFNPAGAPDGVAWVGSILRWPGQVQERAFCTHAGT